MNFPELCCTVNKLKIKQYNLDKAAGDFIRYIDANYGGNFQKEYDQLQNLRKQDSDAVHEDLQDNRRCLKHIKSLIVDSKLENIDLHALKNDMLSLESCTRFVKHLINVQLEYLANEEMVLSIEITNIEMTLGDKNKHENEITKIPRGSVKSTTNNKLNKEVSDFLTFLIETGGHYGSWSHKDHLLFLKVFNKVKNNKKLQETLRNYFPDKPIEKLSEHTEWYKKYLDLRYKQKEAIEKWRTSKAKKENTIVENKPQSAEKESKPTINIESNKIIKDKVEKWRAEKQKRIEKDLEIKGKHTDKIKEIEKQKQLKNQEVKKEVQKWKASKDAKERAEQLTQEIVMLREKERKMLLANQLIRQFQDQDNIIITKRLNKLNINVDPPNSSQNLPPFKKSRKVARDPERIYKATRQWLARTSQDQIEHKNNMFNKHLSLKKIPKLALPVWRHAIQQN